MKRIDVFNTLEKAVKSFTFVERILFYTFVTIFIGSGFVLVGTLNEKLLVEIPSRGGHVTEGIIGTPRFVNPLLVASDADRDVASLVYAGLMKATPEGTLIPELAESYTISDDGLVYTFVLREDATFHDGRPVTADDIVYTVSLAQDPTLKSPRRANWEGVLVEKVDPHTVTFTLSRAYQPFLENTTLGILPKHVWASTPIDQTSFSIFNIDPIGAGPYAVKNFKQTRAGVIEHYELTSFPQYALGEPYISRITLYFYTNEEELMKSLKNGTVSNVHDVPATFAETEKDTYTIMTYPLPRVFGVFFNQDEARVFTNKEVRVALDEVLNRQEIVQDVLYGYGREISGPIPPGLLATSPAQKKETILVEAQGILERNGWEFDEEQGVYVKSDVPLSFTLATANTPELKATAEHIQQQWGKLGAHVDISLFDPGALSNEVIRPREYEALLFGQIIGRDRDPFPFWHSSQRNDPGLNVALYTNITVDSALESIRTTFDEEERLELYDTFQEEISNDVPAAFVFTPDFIYIVDDDLNGIRLGTTITPSERFLNVHEWFINTQRVWGIFAPNTTTNK